LETRAPAYGRGQHAEFSPDRESLQPWGGNTFEQPCVLVESKHRNRRHRATTFHLMTRRDPRAHLPEQPLMIQRWLECLEALIRFNDSSLRVQCKSIEYSRPGHLVPVNVGCSVRGWAVSGLGHLCELHPFANTLHRQSMFAGKRLHFIPNASRLSLESHIAHMPIEDYLLGPAIINRGEALAEQRWMIPACAKRN